MSMRLFTTGAALALACAVTVTLAEVPPRGYCRQPDIHGDTIVFVAEGDLWTVGVEGGVARRLTTHPGDESHPAISPDGTMVAFIGTYEGPREAYVMPIVGGLPRRLTFAGSAIETVGWAPDGRVLVSSRGQSTLPDTRLTLLDAREPGIVRETAVPLAQAAEGVFAGSGADPLPLVFTRQAFQGSHAKRYQGGTAQKLWRFDPGAEEAVPLAADWDGTSRWPMWHSDRIYFATDRDGAINIWSMTLDGRELRPHTRHVDWDVLGPAQSGGRIVYQLGADLRLLDLASGNDAVLDIRLSSDLDQRREQWVDKPRDYMTSAHVSFDGARVAITARGEVFVFPAKQGRRVHVDPGSGVRYRDARFMPDGRSLLVLADRSGEVEFWTLPSDNLGASEQRTTDGTVLRWTGMPSPDGKLMASTDKNHRLFLHDLATGESRLVAQSEYDDFTGIAWSPDSRWFAVVQKAVNQFGQIMLCRVEDASLTPATTDRFDSGSPQFSPDGKWLYFLSERNLVSTVGSPWGLYQPEPYMARTTQIYHLPLAAGLRSPFAPLDELHPEDAKSESKSKNDRTDKPAAKDTTKGDTATDAAPAVEPNADDASVPEPAAPAVQIELAGIEARIQLVPVPPGNYRSLAVNGSALFWESRVRDEEGESSTKLVALEIKRDDRKVITVADKVTDTELSGDGKTLLVQRRGSMHLVPAKAAAADMDKTSVDLAGWTLSFSPQEQWRQMFIDAWRLHRDYFYDPSMHGVDWNAMRDRYLPLVARVTTRAELSDLLSQMMGELSALHTSVRGGDLRRGTEAVAIASLGAVLERDDAIGGWRVQHVYRHDPDDPAAASPLARPESLVRVGEVIVTIDGNDTLAVANPSLLLRNKAGRQVLLEVRDPQAIPGAIPGAVPGAQPESVPVADQGASEGTRRVIVVPIDSRAEADMRYSQWELERREMVEAAGEGRLGYVHLRAMGDDDWTAWAKGFYPVFTRAGLVVDVRHNRGGNIDSWILSRLMRKAWFGWSDRVSEATNSWNMQFAFRGHVVVLCDEWTASDGEAFAEGFRRLGLGTVIGTRTWGGEIWLSGSNVLLDRGVATAAEYGVFGPEGTWLIEGRGVEPDVVVDNLPHETFNGRDRQLERAIEHLLERLKQDPIEPMRRPAFPVKTGSQ